MRRPPWGDDLYPLWRPSIRFSTCVHRPVAKGRQTNPYFRVKLPKVDESLDRTPE